MKWTSYNKGILAEYCAAIMLLLKGYWIRERRYKTPWGEIDLIATKGDSLVFVEVKRRKSLLKGLEAITPHQQRRIENAGQAYRVSSKVKTKYTRLDVVVVTPTWIHHIYDAWRVN